MREFLKNIDVYLLLALLPILGAGLVTMYSFGGDSSLFVRQVIWITVSLVVFIFAGGVDFKFLRQSKVIITLYFSMLFLLSLILVVGKVAKGSQSWFDLGGFSFQPVDLMKVVLILILAKYFSRRHVEIANFKHIFVSGIYMVIPFALVLLQPDFGSAMILLLIWVGMTLVSGISKKHLLAFFLTSVVLFSLSWLFLFKDYQRDRILTFLNPLSDLQDSGYNAYQSTIAVGSGGFLGKGLGYGTQSRLNYLPEYETDFVFAAFSEEWGFIGSFLLIIFYGVVVYRVIIVARYGASNFEVLFAFGVAIMFMSHIVINIGMNIGLLPVTGITLPFMSYGGSHLIAEFLALGILMSARTNIRSAHRDEMRNEFLGL